ncbi:MAG: hypothetical protein FWG26_05730 [Betaproteobacteria bacterium]|nr:hypothetical protein [Betaproteobacteria bacterium]
MSIEDEKSSSLNERCEVFLITGARTGLVFGEMPGAEAGWTRGESGFVLGMTVAALGEDAVAAGLGAAGDFAEVLVGCCFWGRLDCCPALGSDSARWSSALKGCRQLPQRTLP